MEDLHALQIFATIDGCNKKADDIGVSCIVTDTKGAFIYTPSWEALNSLMRDYGQTQSLTITPDGKLDARGSYADSRTVTRLTVNGIVFWHSKDLPNYPPYKICFQADLVQEFSSTPQVNHLGTFDNEMEICFNEEKDEGSILWYYETEDDADETGIGLWFDGNTVVDYDGVFELCYQAKLLLLAHGFDISEIE
jgi:hypothetical protein